MPYLLPSVFSDIADDTVAALLNSARFGDLLHKCRHSSHNIARDIVKALVMGFWNRQYMNGCFRINVMKGIKFFVFGNGIGRDFFIDYFAENAHFKPLFLCYCSTWKIA